MAQVEPGPKISEHDQSREKAFLRESYSRSDSEVMDARGRRRPWLDRGEDVTIRRGGPADEAALVRLAALDEARPLTGEVLVAEVDGELWAALELAEGRTIADPFRPTLAVRELLALRRGSFEFGAGRGGRLRLLRHRTA
jgi:hypothetical protein